MWAHAEIGRFTNRYDLVVEKVKIEVTAPQSPDPEADEVRAAVRMFAEELGLDVVTLREIAETLDRDVRTIARGDTEGQVTGIDLHDESTLRRLLEQAASMDANAGGAS